MESVDTTTQEESIAALLRERLQCFVGQPYTPQLAEQIKRAVEDLLRHPSFPRPIPEIRVTPDPEDPSQLRIESVDDE